MLWKTKKLLVECQAGGSGRPAHSPISGRRSKSAFTGDDKEPWGLGEEEEKLASDDEDEAEAPGMPEGLNKVRALSSQAQSAHLLSA